MRPFAPLLAARGGGLGPIVSWFIRVVIYDICVTSLAEILGVSRLVALFIFLGLLMAFSGAAYVVRNKMSSQADDL